uniref:Conotoxin-like unassigned superfamily 10 n=1 Tax=Conus ermineus TaxID=55423 RepID=A0A346CJ48_CONER|nr:conotoxin-like precursor unassigned superfamily 10 [Conus ermineus]
MKSTLFLTVLMAAVFLTFFTETDTTSIFKAREKRSDSEEFPCAGTFADCRGQPNGTTCCDTGACYGEVCYY